MSPLERLLATIATATTLAALARFGLLAVDAVFGTPASESLDGWMVALACSLAEAGLWGVGAGVIVFLADAGDRAVGRWVGRSSAGAIVVGLATAMLMGPSLREGLSGRALARADPGARLRDGAVVLVALAGAAGWVGAREVTRALRRGRRWPRRLALTAGLLMVSAALWSDRVMYVGLYQSLHTALELAAVAGLMSVAALLSWEDVRGWPVISGSLAVFAVLTTAAFVGTSAPRAWAERHQGAGAASPLYVRRQVARMKRLERGFQGRSASRLVQLAQAYDLSNTTLDPAWRSPPPPPPAERRRLAQQRGSARPNILIYYVDTLRADVASDPSIMPELVRFSGQSLDFTRAYSVSSATREVLPVLVSGSVVLRWLDQQGLLYEAKRGGMSSRLFIPTSALQYVREVLPGFAFDDVESAADHNYTHRGVREAVGHGANVPTAALLTQQVEDWLARRAERKPFFAWVFNFDVHSSWSLDETYIRSTAARYEIVEPGAVPWRYRVAARGVDAAFGHLLSTLQDLGLAEDTIVVFVSDHGEGLGYRDFDVHGTHLWEPLIRVPLLLRIPGVKPQRIGEPVSLADLAPTLVPYMTEAPNVGQMHGEDLLRFSLPGAPRARRLPIVIYSTEGDAPSRVGIVDGRRKLVVPVDWGAPELHSLTDSDPDVTDSFSEERGVGLRLLGELLRSPLGQLLASDEDGVR
ncbi:MAG: sulfatase [Sorangiineae bacterium]|nr:sulfatase [Polyangiaceae bacterium]MEB2321651.1 sulfatase [Sorangiineae bacterium]